MKNRSPKIFSALKKMALDIIEEQNAVIKHFNNYITVIDTANELFNDYYSIKTPDSTSIPKLIKDVSRDEFLKLRFANNNSQVKIGENAEETIGTGGDNISYTNYGNGSITLRKDGRYQGSFYLNNKRYFVYGKSQTDTINLIRKKRKELKESLDNTNNDNVKIDKENINNKSDNKLNVNKNTILNDWFYFWIDNFKSKKVKKSTYIKDVENYERYIKNVIGKFKIGNISSIDIQNVINSVLAYSMKKKTMTLLKSIFEIAHQIGAIKINPMVMVVLPKQNEDDNPLEEKDKKILRYADELRLIDHLLHVKSQFTNSIIFMLYTGTRRGEMLGLTWKNVDFENMKITISQQYNIVTQSITSPKSKSAYRIIPILPPVFDVLRKMALCEHSPDDLIFLSSSKFVTQKLNKFTKRLNIDISVHSLRHTFASRLYACGLDQLVIRDMLGHESIDTTLNVYTHVLQTEDKFIIDKMKEWFTI